MGHKGAVVKYFFYLSALHCFSTNIHSPKKNIALIKEGCDG